MFGSRVAAAFVQSLLEDEPVVVAALTEGAAGIVAARVVPPDVRLPALIHYPESLPYSTPIGSEADPVAQTGRYVVRLVCTGWSDTPILDAAEAMFTALHGAREDEPGGSVYLDAIEEWPLTQYVETADNIATPYRELGTVFAVEIITGG